MISLELVFLFSYLFHLVVSTHYMLIPLILFFFLSATSVICLFPHVFFPKPLIFDISIQLPLLFGTGLILGAICDEPYCKFWCIH